MKKTLRALIAASMLAGGGVVAAATPSQAAMIAPCRGPVACKWTAGTSGPFRFGAILDRSQVAGAVVWYPRLWILR